MTILVYVINQELRLATPFKTLIDGTQEFIKFKFLLDNAWAEITTFAQFTQNDVAYNVYLDEDNCVYLPPEINTGTFTLMLYGTGDNTIGTSNYLTIKMDDNILIENAQSTEITQSLYSQLVNSVNSVNNNLNTMTTARASDVGKYLKVRSVNNGKVSAWEFDNGASSGGGGGSGQDGQDGYSPTITVTNITGGHRVSITDVNGTKTFNVMNGTNGTNGTDGVSPTVSVTNITNGHRVSITDATGTNTFDVMNGSGSGGGGSSVNVDNTLTISGAAADSKTVGDRINGLDTRISTIEQEEAETADLLLGYTPQTLSSPTHIKLTTDSTASYSIAETIADYENNSTVTLTNVTQTWENDKMVFTATGNSASECYVDIVINGLNVGQQYTFIVNRGEYIRGTTGGYFRISDSSGTEITSFDVSENVQTATFTTTTSSITIRLTPSINYYWETYDIRTATIIGIELRSEITESFTGEVNLGIISANATITSTPASQVYAVLKKSEISKSLIGYTPLTIEEESNIELSSSEATQYTISNIFVGDFDGNGDDVEVRFVDTTLTKENGKMIFTATGSSASSCWADLRLNSLVVGRTYTLTVTRGEYIEGTTGGYFIIYDRDGEELGRLPGVTQNVETLDFVATTTFARVRLMPTTNSYWESNIKTATIVGAIVTTQISDNFNGTVDLGRVPVGYRISSNPVCQVYDVRQKEEIRVDSSLNINSRNPVQNKVVTEVINEIRNTSGSRLVGQTCVVLGDSVAAFRTPPEDIPSIIAQRTGMTVYNCAFGGCRISDYIIAEGDTDPWEAFCFVRLADAITSGDWSYQEANIDTLQELDYEGYSPEDHFETIKSVNWSNVDILVIFFAGNDAGNVRFDNAQDDDDTYYYLGAFRYCIRKILTAYPHLKLLVVGTDYHKTSNSNTDDITYTIDGQTYHYYDWSDRLMEECKNFHIPTLDWYRSNGLNSLTVDYYMTSDGKHPNYIGNQLLGNQIANRLLSIY